MARYTITSALIYANGPIHLGHLAGAILPADIFARYKRLCGDEVVFITGSDEGGVAIEMAAQQKKIGEKELIDQYAKCNKECLEGIDISFDIFDRTSLPHHVQCAQEFFQILKEKGAIFKSSQPQFYDTEKKKILTDRYIIGQCPYCLFEKAYGDQCEACGISINVTDLINPRSTLTGKKPIMKNTTHWYLPLDKYQSDLEQWISTKKWKKNVLGQSESWLKKGLQPRAITRDMNWGIPVPDEIKKVLYVWFEAPIGYISATKIWAKKKEKDWEPFWKDSATKLVHFIGKDNIVFHAIIFPLMLKLHTGYILPDTVCAQEFLNWDDQKFSTSRKHAIWLKDFLTTQKERKDSLRYALIHQMPEYKDSNFTWENYKNLHNQILVAVLANFIHRVWILIERFFEGKVPKPGHLSSDENHFLKEVEKKKKEVMEHLNNYHFREGLYSWIDIARIGNKYLTKKEPWKWIKKDKKYAGTILYIGLQAICYLAYLGEPFIPSSMQKLFHKLSLTKQNWHSLKGFLIPADRKLPPPFYLFTPI